MGEPALQGAPADSSPPTAVVRDAAEEEEEAESDDTAQVDAPLPHAQPTRLPPVSERLPPPLPAQPSPAAGTPQTSGGGEVRMPHLGRPRGVLRPPAPTPFPPGYVSALVRAAQAMGVGVPDVNHGRRCVRVIARVWVWGGGRGGGGCRARAEPAAPHRAPRRVRQSSVCPPYVGSPDATSQEQLAAIANVTIALVTVRGAGGGGDCGCSSTPARGGQVSFKTPGSLYNAMRSWDESGLYDLVDDRVSACDLVDDRVGGGGVEWRW
jgi:hypothetical protein